MTSAEWTKKIKNACDAAGTYRPFFDDVILQLAQILETRDNAIAMYKASGGTPVVTHTNKAGATNLTKNPALAIINECNSQALAYWRDLGLTPTGYKRLGADDDAKRDTSFEDMLAKIGI